MPNDELCFAGTDCLVSYFLEERFFVDRFLVEPFFDPFFDPPFFDPFFAGTFPPSLRASERPMAIACFLLVTFLPEPLFNVPRLRSRIVFSTFSPAFFPYLAIRVSPPWPTFNTAGDLFYRWTIPQSC